MNRAAGHLVRTKAAESDEGGWRQATLFSTARISHEALRGIRKGDVGNEVVN